MSLNKGQTNSGSFKKGENRSPHTQFVKGLSASPSTQFGNVPAWNKGLSGEEYKKHFKNMGGQFKKGRIPTNKGILKPTTPLRRAIRDCFKMRCWREQCFKRDKYMCQECKKIGGKLSVHHKNEFENILRNNNITSYEQALFCEEFWDLSNGITLCWDCHKKKHVIRRGGDA